MRTNREVNPFDTEAGKYDQWFESPRGRRIFAQEVACLLDLIGDDKGRWMEVGVGTGRFAQALSIQEGVDPSRAMLAMAVERGVRTQVGYGEELPYSNEIFDGALMVVTICFLTDPAKALQECRRVLKEKGRLIVGLVPADSLWGKLYAQKRRGGHRFYSAAQFYTCKQVIDFAINAGFLLGGTRSCLFTPPDEPIPNASFHEEIVPNAGFVALEFIK